MRVVAPGRVVDGRAALTSRSETPPRLLQPSAKPRELQPLLRVRSWFGAAVARHRHL